MRLSDRYSIFVGFKLEGTLKRELQSISGPNERYVSRDAEGFLRLVERGGDLFVGKVIDDGLSTDRVDDVRRNVLSIVQRLCPDTRLPSHLEICVCEPEEPAPPAAYD